MQFARTYHIFPELLNRTKSHKKALHTACIIPLCCIITLAMLYNVILPIDGPGNVSSGDMGQMVWNLWSATEAVVNGENPYQTDMVFYPIGANLSTHTLAAGFLPIGLAVKLLTGGDLLYPLYSFKICIFLSFSLILFFSYATLKEVGYNFFESFIPAMAYAFCDFFCLHWSHLNHISGFFIPMCSLLLIKLYNKPTGRLAAATSFVLGSAIYFTEFSFFIYTALAIYVLFLLTRLEERRGIFKKISELGIKPILLSSAVFLVVTAPFLFNWLTSEALKPAAFQFSSYSSNLAGFFIPSPQTTWLYGDVFAKLVSRITIGMAGYEIFLGYPFLFLSIIGSIRLKTHFKTSLLLTAIVFFLLSMGPSLKVFDHETGIVLPFSQLMKVPPLNQFRTPVRFVVMGMFLMTFLAANGVHVIYGIIKKHTHKLSSYLFLFGVVSWIIAETYNPLPTPISFIIPKKLLEAKPKGPILNLPVDPWSGYYSFLQIFHGKPIATGYLARFSQKQMDHVLQLKGALYGYNAATYLKETGLKSVLLHDQIPYVVLQNLRNLSMDVIDMGNWSAFYEVARIGEVVLPGSVWNTAGTYLIGQDKEMTIAFKNKLSADRVDILADHNDRYIICFFDGNTILGTMIASTEALRGLQWRCLNLPGGLKEKKFDKITIKGLDGDGLYSIRCLILLKVSAN